MSLDGFTSSTAGEQIFGLAGSVQGTYTGVLTLQGTDLDLLDFITVSGQQYTTVTFGEMQKTDSVVMVPVEIVSTANGGAMLYVGDAVITLQVTYVAPAPVITSATIFGQPFIRQSSYFWRRVDEDNPLSVDQVRAWIGNTSSLSDIRLNGQNLASSYLSRGYAFVQRGAGVEVTSSTPTSIVVYSASSSQILLGDNYTLGSEVEGYSISPGDVFVCSFNFNGIVFEYDAPIE